MALTFRWTKRAQNNFDKILQYLDEHFGKNTKRAFIRKTFAVIENLQEFPKLGTTEIKDKGIYGFQISKHNRLFYKLTQLGKKSKRKDKILLIFAISIS